MTLPTQAAITRAVKAVVAGYVAAGVRVTGGTVAFHNGDFSVCVTADPDSPLPHPIKPEGVNVHDFKQALAGRAHAPRRP